MSYFLNINKTNSEKIAAIDEENNQITYGELIGFSNDLNGIISTRSVVFHFAENSVASLSFYIACMNLKAVPLLLSPQTNFDLVQSLIDEYQPNYIIAPDRICENFQGQNIKEFGNYRVIRFNDYAHKLYEDLSLLLPTSGSTGSPKLVRHSYKNLESSAQSIANFFELDATERAFSFLPMFYTMGLSVIHSHLKVGATVVLIKSAMTDAVFWKLLKESKATSLTGVPYSFEILKKLRFFRMKLPFLKIITQGGGKMSAEIYNDCIEFANLNDVKFYPTYGQTEGTARMAFLDPSMVQNKKGSIGKAIPNGKLSILMEDGVESFEGEAEGEMIFRGPNVTLGYANRLTDLSLGDERKGVLLTGDIVKRDSDGYYYIVGRKSRFLKLFGIRVALDEIESLITAAFNMECVCVGNDQKMIVLVTKKDTEKEIIDFIVEKTGLFHQLFSVKYVEEIPRNETGKVVFNERN